MRFAFIYQVSVSRGPRTDLGIYTSAVPQIADFQSLRGREEIRVHVLSFISLPTEALSSPESQLEVMISLKARASRHIS